MKHNEDLEFGIKFDIEGGVRTAIETFQQFRPQLEAALSGDYTKELAKTFESGTKKIKEAVDELRQFNDEQQRGGKVSKEVSDAYSKQSGLLGEIAAKVKSYLSLTSLIGVVGKIREVTAELELQRVSLGAMIGDTQKAAQIWGEIKEYSMHSVFSVEEIMKSTKQLSAFNIEAERIVPTFKMLADVSAGVGTDLNRVLWNFAQVRSQTILTGRDLRDFGNQGVPMLQGLADMFSELEGRAVSTQEVFQRVQSRMVSFEDVEEVFKRMTSEGGKFFEMQEKQSESLYGSWNKMKNAATLMYDAIGEGNRGVMKGAIDMARGLMENWQAIEVTIKSLVTGLGSYKVAMIAVNFVSKDAITGVSGLNKALSSLGNFFKTNWIGLLVTAISAFAFSIKKYSDNLKDLDKAQEDFTKHNDRMNKQQDSSIKNFKNAADHLEKFNKIITDHENNLSALGQSQKDLSSSTGELTDEEKKYQSAIKGRDTLMSEIQKEYPQYLQNLSNEADKTEAAKKMVVELTTAYKNLTESRREDERERVKGEVEQLEEQILEVQAKIDKNKPSTQFGLWYRILRGKDISGGAIPNAELESLQNQVNVRREYLKSIEELEKEEQRISEGIISGIKEIKSRVGKDYSLFNDEEIKKIITWGDAVEALDDVYKKNAAEIERMNRAKGKWTETDKEVYANMVYQNKQIDEWANKYNQTLASKAKVEGAALSAAEKAAQARVDKLKLENDSLLFLEKEYEKLDKERRKIDTTLPGGQAAYDEAERRMREMLNNAAKPFGEKGVEDVTKVFDRKAIKEHFEKLLKDLEEDTAFAGTKAGQEYIENLKKAFSGLEIVDQDAAWKAYFDAIEDIQKGQIKDIERAKKLLDELFSKDIPEGAGFSFRISESIAKMNNAIKKIREDEVLMLTYNHNIDKEQIKERANLEIEAEKEKNNLRAQNLASHYIQMKMQENGLWEVYRNMNNASMSQLRQISDVLRDIESNYGSGLIDALGGEKGKEVKKIFEEWGVALNSGIDGFMQSAEEAVIGIENEIYRLEAQQGLELIPDEAIEKLEEAKDLLLFFLGFTPGVKYQKDNAAQKTEDQILQEKTRSINAIILSMRAIPNLGENWAKGFEAAQAAVSAISQTMSSTATKGEKISGIVSAAFSVMGSLVNIFDSEGQKAIDNAAAYALEISKHLDEIANKKGIGDSLFTTDSFNKIKQLQSSISIAFTDATISANTFFRHYDERMVHMVASSIAFSELFAGWFGGGASRFKKQNQGAMEFFEGIRKYNMDSLEDVNRMLADIDIAYAKTKDKLGIAYLDQAKAAAESAKKSIEELHSLIKEMVGDIGNSLRNVLLEAYKNAETAVVGISETINKSLEDIVANQMFSEIFGGVFDQFGEDFAKAIASEAPVEALSKLYGNLFDSIMSGQNEFYNALDLLKKMALEIGIDLFSPEEKDEVLKMEKSLALLEARLEHIKNRDSKELDDLLKQRANMAFDLTAWEQERENVLAAIARLENMSQEERERDANTWDYDMNYYRQKLYELDRLGELVFELNQKIAELEQQIANGLTDEDLEDIRILEDEISKLNSEIADKKAIIEWRDALDKSLDDIDSDIGKLNALKQAYNDLSDSILNEIQQEEVRKELSERIAEKEKEILKDLLKTYETYNQQKERIDNDYAEKRKFLLEQDLDPDALTEMLDMMEKERAKSISDLERQAIETGEIWEKLFDGIIDVQVREAVNIVNVIKSNIQKAVEDGLLSEKDAHEMYTQLDNYLKGAFDALTGTTQDAIVESIVNGFKEGKKSIEDFATDFEELMRNAVIQGFKVNMLTPLLDDFYEQFALAMGDGLNDANIADLTEMWNRIVTDGESAFSQLAILFKEIFNVDLAPITDDTEEQLISKYQTFAEKRKEIQDKYDKDIAEMQRLSDQAVIQAEKDLWDERIAIAEEGRQKELDANEKAWLESLNEWKVAMGDLADYSKEEIYAAVAALREMIAASDILSEEQKRELNKKLDEVIKKTDELDADKLTESLEKAKSILNGIEQLISAIGEIFGSLGIKDEGAKAISNIGNIVTGLTQAVDGYFTGNWIGIVTGAAKIMSNAFTLLGINLNSSEVEAARLKDKIDDLSYAFGRLKRAMELALGYDKVAGMQKMSDNLQQQIDTYTSALEKELAKKKAWWDPLGWFTGQDADKIKAYQQYLDGLSDSLHDVAMQMKKDFLQTDVESFTKKLVDTWTQAYDSVSDRTAAMNKDVTDMFKEIAKEAMLTKVVIKPIDDLLDGIFKQDIGALNMDMVKETQEKINQIFTDAWQWLEPFWKDLSDQENQFLQDVMKTAKTFTEDQGNILIGHIVAMRLNLERQVNELVLQTSILRNQQQIQERLDTNVLAIKGISSDLLAAYKTSPYAGTGI